MMDVNMKRNITIGIIVGITVFIICYLFVQPVMDFLTPKFLFVSAKICSLFSDELYRNAAKMDRNSMDATMLSFFFGFVASLPILNFILTFNKEKIKHILNKRKPSAWKDRLSSIAMLLIILLLLFVQYSDYYLNLQFERKIRILSPYLSDKQEKELVSQWVLMDGRSDYKHINDVLRGHANKFGINKPKGLWEKSFWE